MERSPVGSGHDLGLRLAGRVQRLVERKMRESADMRLDALDPGDHRFGQFDGRYISILISAAASESGPRQMSSMFMLVPHEVDRSRART